MNSTIVEMIRAVTPIVFGFFAVVVAGAGMITKNRDSANIAATLIGAAAGSYIPQAKGQSANAETIENVNIEK